MDGSVVVLGASAANGVGGALSRRFAHEGHHVYVCGRTQDKVDTLAGEIVDAGGSAKGVRADVTSPDDLDALFAQVSETGPLAAVLFNAGNNAIIPFEKLDAETFEAFWRVGCYGAFLVAQRAIPKLKEQGSGSK